MSTYDPKINKKRLVEQSPLELTAGGPEEVIACPLLAGV